MMKNNIVIIIVFLFGISTKAQNVNGISIKDLDIEYLKVTQVTKLLSTTINIKIDYGQRIKSFSTDDVTILKDKEGKTWISIQL
jgi:hypothetical protein